MHRRQYLLAASTTAAAFVAGCSDTESDGSDGGGSDGNSNENTESTNSGSENSSESGSEGEDEGNSAEDSSEEQESQDITQRGPGEDVLENAGLTIQEHDYVEEDEFNAYVEGIVENTTDEAKDYAEVQVRAYDADGNQLDSYFDNTTDLQAGGTWAFEVMILDAEEFSEYDIGVTDSAI